MNVAVEVLRTNDSRTFETHSTNKRNEWKQLVDIGARLRNADPTVCAIFHPFIRIGVWTGNCNKEQYEAITRNNKTGWHTS